MKTVEEGQRLWIRMVTVFLCIPMNFSATRADGYVVRLLSQILTYLYLCVPVTFGTFTDLTLLSGEMQMWTKS